MDFCLEPDRPRKRVVPQLPPIWSMLVYMWLTETIDIDDEVLMQQLGIPDPGRSATDTPSSNVKSVHSRTPVEVRKFFSFSFIHATNEMRFLQSSENMLVQYLDTHPITLTPVDRNKPQSERAEEHFVHLDLKIFYFSGPCSVYVSRKSNMMVKFAYQPTEDKAELERMLSNEKAAHDKLQLLAGWAISRCYGEYLWYGGRALVLSHEGPSLLDHGMGFTCLGREERCDFRLASAISRYLSSDLSVDQTRFVWNAVPHPLSRSLPWGL